MCVCSCIKCTCSYSRFSSAKGASECQMCSAGRSRLYASPFVSFQSYLCPHHFWTDHHIGCTPPLLHSHIPASTMTYRMYVGACVCVRMFVRVCTFECTCERLCARCCVFRAGRSAGKGQKECQSCVPGKYSTRMGSTVCTNCKVGSWFPSFCFSFPSLITCFHVALGLCARFLTMIDSEAVFVWSCPLLCLRILAHSHLLVCAGRALRRCDRQ